MTRSIGAGLVVDEEDLVPGLAAVDGLEDAAVGVVRPLVAAGRDVDDVGVGRMDDDAGDRVRVGQAHVRPGLAAVDRFEDADAGLGAAEDVVLARPDPDDVLGRTGRGRRRRWPSWPCSRRPASQVVPSFSVFQTPPEAVADVHRVAPALGRDDGDVRHRPLTFVGPRNCHLRSLNFEAACMALCSSKPLSRSSGSVDWRTLGLTVFGWARVRAVRTKSAAATITAD